MTPPYEQSSVGAKVVPTAKRYRGFPYTNNGVPTDSKNRFSPDLLDINFEYHYLILAFCFSCGF
jgi:hypothetical protein